MQFISLPVTHREIPIPAKMPEAPLNPLLVRFREHEASGNDPEETVLTPLEEWLHWMHWGDQEVTDDEDAIEHAHKVFKRLAAFRRRV